MTGIIVINKLENFTSFDVVAVLRGILKEKKIGHTGTLDPMATGVLPMLIGKATKACDLLPQTEKSYEAKFKLGIKTDTGDIWGKVEEEEEMEVSKEILTETLQNFRGNVYQIPPMYSAVSVGGKRLYELARKGIEIEREKREIFIEELELLDFDGKEGTLKIKCSKGTYIRTLIEDIAHSVGAIATMTALVRTQACGFDLENAITIEELRKLKDKGEIATVLHEVGSLFSPYPVASVSEAQQKRFLNGGELSLQRLKLPKIALNEGDMFSVYGNEFLGLGKIDGENLKFVKHFME